MKTKVSSSDYKSSVGTEKVTVGGDNLRRVPMIVEFVSYNPIVYKTFISLVENSFRVRDTYLEGIRRK